MEGKGRDGPPCIKQPKKPALAKTNINLQILVQSPFMTSGNTVGLLVTTPEPGMEQWQLGLLASGHDPDSDKSLKHFEIAKDERTAGHGKKLIHFALQQRHYLQTANRSTHVSVITLSYVTAIYQAANSKVQSG